MAAVRRVTFLGIAAGMALAIAAIVWLALGVAAPRDPPRQSADPVIQRSAKPHLSASATTDACRRTVKGTTAAAIAAASADAGAGTVCIPDGRYEGSFTAAVAGQTWQLAAGALLAGPVSIEAPDVRIRGGTVELPNDGPWAEGVTIDADRATIQNVTFRGGGLVISVKGRDGTRILDNRFSDQSGTAIFVWGEGRGADDTLIQGNTIDQTATTKVSPISSRAADHPEEGVVNRRITVRSNRINQGDATTGWFGVELKLSPDAVIVDNDIRGGRVLVSLPDSDRAIVSGNRLDLRGSATWGVEIASSDDVTVADNTFAGDGPRTKDTAVSMNSGSLRAVIDANTATDLGTLVNLTGDGHLISNNCLAGVGRIIAYRSSAGSDIRVIGNGPC